MWYALIFGGILGMLFCNRVSRSRKRPRGGLRYLASHTSTVFAASFVLAVICAMIQFSAAGPKARKQERVGSELAYTRALGNVLTKETLAKAERVRGILIVAEAPESDGATAYLEAIREGVEEASGNFPVELALVEATAADGSAAVADERAISARRTISVTDLESLARKFPDNNVVICVSNLPMDYSASGFAARVVSKDLAVGFVLNDVYMLGDEIHSGQVTACALPKRAMSYPPMDVPQQTMDAFKERYFLLTEGNVTRFALDNRRMMHVQRR